MILFIIDVYFFISIYIILEKFLESKVTYNLFFSNPEIGFRIKSMLIVFIFLFFFIFLFRLTKFFLNLDSNYIDMKFYLYFIGLFLSNATTLIFKIYVIFFSFYSFFLLRLLKKYLFIYFRMNFFRLHFFYFIRNVNYRRVFYKFCLMDDIIIFFFSKKYINVYFFFKLNFFKLIYLYFIIRCLFFDNFIFYIGFIKYYLLYYLIININDFVKKTNVDFDRAILEQYYPQFFCITRLGRQRLIKYQKLLIFGFAETLFMETILFVPGEYVPENFYFFPFYDKYSSCENDVYEISLKKNPIIIPFF